MLQRQVSVLVGSVRIAVAYAIWRLTGFRLGGAVLVRALGDQRETVRTIAGMLLVRAGSHAKPLLEKAMAQRFHLPVVLTMLADIGDHGVEREIRELREDPDPQVAQAASHALRILARH